MDSESKNTTKNSKVVRVSLSPVDYDPKFDVVHQLREFRSMYVGDPNVYLSLYKMPSYIDMELGRLREAAEIEGGSGIGVNPAIICCLGNGLGMLRELPAFGRLRGIRRQILMSSADESPGTLLAVHNLMRAKISFSVKSEMQFMPKRSVCMPQKLIMQLNEFKVAIGSDQSTVCILSLMATMKDQPVVHKEYRKHFAEAVDSFLVSLETRVELIEKILK